VVATARPELLERRPAWGGGKLNATTMGLSPLTDDETSRVIEHVLKHAALPPETGRILLERAGGNPLYARQFSELYRERGSAESMPLPETLQGIIAARIDGLSSDEKTVLQDAAVVGKVFWGGPLGRDPDELEATLSNLARKGFLARQRQTTVVEEDEWAFAHILLRDAAYGQIPRAERGEKHRRTAQWLEALGRPEDHAAVIAYHWRSALELTRAAGRPVDDLEGPTRRALRAAGERAFAVNAYPEAARHLEAALALWPTDDRRRPELLYRHAEALYLASDDGATAALAGARDALLHEGQSELAAGAELWLSRMAWHAGRTEEASAHQAAAEALIGDADSLMAAKVLAYGARTRVIGGDPELGLEMATRALTIAEGLGADELRAHAMCTIGLAGRALGQDGAREIIQQALDVAIAVRSPDAGAIANNLAVQAFLDLQLVEALRLLEEGLRTAEYFGDASGSRWLRGQVAFFDYVVGDWARFTTAADEFIAECEAGSPNYMETSLRLQRARAMMARADVDGALRDVPRALELAREQRDPQELMPTVGCAILVLEETGHRDQAEALTAELLDLADRYPYEATWALSLDFLFSRAAGSREPALRATIARSPEGPWKAVALACLERDFIRAAELFATAGSPTGEARLRLRAADDLAEAGRLDEARAQARLALAFHRTVGATGYIERERQLLGATA
jgi:tetratricopeptide (TPR) repeat protein